MPNLIKAYLDVETDRAGNLCVIGAYVEGTGFVQFHGEDVTAGNVEALMSRAHIVVTFNGDGFDLPVIKKHLNLDLLTSHHSLDLYKVKRGLGIKGGLKDLEKMFGIRRRTEGMNGFKAVLLWEKYTRKGNVEALNLLLEYNKEDVLNLISLERMLIERVGVER